MANINITSDAWTEISITSGTIQNISATADIELSAEQTDNSGVVLKPSELYQWDNETIYARAVTEDTGALRVVNFKKAAGGGGYVLPVASASTLGGIKVGNNLSIDADTGVLSATGGAPVNYSTTEQQIGTWIDGKPLYKKTYSFNLPTTAGNQDIVIDSAIANMDNIFIENGFIIYNSNTYMSINTRTDDTQWTNLWVNTVLQCIRGAAGSTFYGIPCFLTIKYTKTTD